MAFWNRKKKQDDTPKAEVPPPPPAAEPAVPPPPGGRGWDAALLAFASGAGIVAITIMEVEFFPALVLGELAGVALDEAHRRHDERMKAQHDFHLSMLKPEADAMVDRLAGKSVAELTDKDRFRLTLLSDWGLVAPDRAEKMPPALRAEVLATQLTVSCQQQGVPIRRLAAEFAFPKLSAEERATPEGLRALEKDRDHMKAILLERSQPGFLQRIGKKVSSSVVGRLLERAAKDVRYVGEAVGIGFHIPSLRKAWSIVTAKGPAGSAEEFIDRVGKNLKSDYENGLRRVRCATRRHYKASGIDHETVAVAKPEGGLRAIVRPKQQPPAP